MARKKKNDIVGFMLENGPMCIAQFVSSDETWYVITNPVAFTQSEDGERLNMNPLLRYSKKNSETKIPMNKITAIYQPTDGLADEYVSVFVDETKKAIPSEHAHPEAEAEELETAEV